MRHALKTGFSFGLTSGIITTLGLMVGLNSGTHSKLAVVGGILTIAIADAFSDALGVHISKESESRHTTKDIWESTAATFVAKLVFALTFLVPVMLLELNTAMIVSVAWGLLALGVLSYIIAKGRNSDPRDAILEHIGIALIVIITTHFVGDLIRAYFG